MWLGGAIRLVVASPIYLLYLLEPNNNGYPLETMGWWRAR